MKLLKIICFALLLATLVVIGGVLGTSAAPLRDYYGAQPLYDSGWVTSTAGYQTFEHSLDYIPSLWSLTVLDASTGEDRAASPTRFELNSGDQFGHLVVDITHEEMEVVWYPAGIAYSHTAGKWYQRGTDKVRLQIFAAGDPWRP